MLDRSPAPYDNLGLLVLRGTQIKRRVGFISIHHGVKLSLCRGANDGLEFRFLPLGI